MTLMEECLIALGDCEVINEEKEVDKIFDQMIKMFPVTKWGRIDWEVVNRKIEGIEKMSLKELIKTLCLNDINVEKKVYILWDEATLPIVKINLQKIFDNFDDVMVVSFNTWIFCPEENYVIEFYHENETTIGLI